MNNINEDKLNNKVEFKTIRVVNSTWKELKELKFGKRFYTYDELINFLLNIYERSQIGNHAGGGEPDNVKQSE